MCGRGACSLDPNALKKACNVQRFLNADKYTPSYNLCPNNFIPVLLLQNAMHKYYKHTETSDNKANDDSTDTISQNDRILSTMRWGLVPSFSKDGTSQFHTINARKDTIKSKPMYRRLVNKKRCVVLLNGYYEWKTSKNSKNKQPYYFSPNGPLMYIAALWDIWCPRHDNDPNKYLLTVSVITTDSNKHVSFCHDRMPLLMTEDCIQKWLNVDKYSIDECFTMIDESNIELKSYAVPREIVGNTKIKGIECIQTLDQYETKKRKTGLHKFFKSVKQTKKKDDNDEDEDELQKAIEASKTSYKNDKEKRGKKRKLNDIHDLDQHPAKKQKLNSNS